MEFMNNPEPLEVKTEPNHQISLQDKIQKLIDNFTSLKEKYATLKEDYEKVLTNNIELEEEKTQWVNEKIQLEQKVAHLDEELQTKNLEIASLKDSNVEFDSLTKTAVGKIDQILAELDLEI
jgi:chromosome segregation ATPase